MNQSLFFAALFSVVLTFAAGQTSTSNGSTLTKDAYFDRNSQDLRELRREIEGKYQDTPLAGQAQLAPYLNALASAEQALAEFKTAPEIEYSVRKNSYESAKARAVELWASYRSTFAQPSISNDAANSTPEPSRADGMDRPATP